MCVRSRRCDYGDGDERAVLLDKTIERIAAAISSVYDVTIARLRAGNWNVQLLLENYHSRLYRLLGNKLVEICIAMFMIKSFFLL